MSNAKNKDRVVLREPEDTRRRNDEELQPDVDDGTDAPTEEDTLESEVGEERSVFKEFPDGWKFGYVTEYDEETTTFTVTYTDEAVTVEKYHLQNLTELVDILYECWEVGSFVYKEFTDGWKFGFVYEYSQASFSYTIQYDDGTMESYPFGSKELDQIVNHASEYHGYEEGTQVLREEDGAYGTILLFEADCWTYTVEWDETGAQEEIENMTLVMSMVEAARSIQPDNHPK